MKKMYFTKKMKPFFLSLLLIVLTNSISCFAQTPFSANWPLQNDGNPTTTGSITASPMTTSANFTQTSFFPEYFVSSPWTINATDKYLEFKITANENTNMVLENLSYTCHFQEATTSVFSYIYYSYDNFTTSNYLDFNAVQPTGSNGEYASNFSLSSLTLASNQTISIRIIADSNATNPPPFQFVMSNFAVSGTSTLACDTPVINFQPNNQTVCENSPIVLTVDATNAVSYQWKKDGNLIAGEITNTLPIANATLTDVGNYTVDVIGDCETVSSNSASVTVNVLPVITNYFTFDENICLGNSINIFVNATNAIQYIWKRNGQTVHIGGSGNSSIYSKYEASNYDNGDYTVDVIGSCGTVTSNTIHITIGLPPVINSHPQSQLVNLGQNTYLYADASSSSGGPINYTWYRNNTIIANTTSNYYTIYNAQLYDDANYHVLVYNNCGFVQSNIATITVNKVVITEQPISQNFCPNSSVTLSVTATDLNIYYYDDLYYTWFKDNVYLTSGSSSTYTITNATAADEGNYHAWVYSNTTQGVVSNFATLTMLQTTTPFYQDLDNDGYGNLSVSQIVCSQPAGYVSNNLDCDDSNVTVYPDATEICGDGFDNNCNGIVDEGCSIGLTSVLPTQCGSLLPKINSYIYSNLISGAEAYRFRVTDLTTNQVQTIDKLLRVFQLTQLLNTVYNRTYKVEVAVKLNEIWQPFGLPCSVTTPSPNATIQNSHCGITIDYTTSTKIVADLVPNVKGYRFRVKDVYTNEEYIIDRLLREFRTSSLTNINIGKTYTVEVAVKNMDDSYSSYGPICHLYTEQVATTFVPPPFLFFPIENPESYIYATPVLEAIGYKFFVTNYNGSAVEIIRTTPSLDLKTLPVEFQLGSFYVYVAVIINSELGEVTGHYSNYYLTGFIHLCPDCVTPPDAKLSNETTFEASAFPNPFEENFKVIINSNSKDAVEIKVFDMLGKLIETKTTLEKEIEIGNNYQSGIYNVIVSQDDQLQNIRMIKR